MAVYDLFIWSHAKLFVCVICNLLWNRQIVLNYKLTNTSDYR